MKMVSTIQPIAHKLDFLFRSFGYIQDTPDTQNSGQGKVLRDYARRCSLLHVLLLLQYTHYQ